MTIRMATCLLALASALAAAGDGELTMETAVRRALERNERSRAASEQARAADALLAQARGFFFPGVTVSGTYTRRPYEVSRTVGDSTITVQKLNALAASANASLTIFSASSFPLLRNALFSARAAHAGLAETRRLLAYEVCTAFLATLGADQMVAAADHRHQLALQTLEAARARHAAGLVSVNDVTRAELEAASAESALIAARGQAQAAFLNLGYLLDLDVRGQSLREPEPLLAEARQAPPEGRELAPQARQLRADIARLRWLARARRALVLEPQLKWLPSLNLAGQYRWTNEAGLTGKSTNWSVGMNLNWTIFDGFARNGQARERRALARVAELELAAAERQVEVQLQEAMANLATRQAGLRQAEVALEVARRNADENGELYRQGLTGALQAADAVVRLYEGEVALVQARHDLSLSFLTLRLAQGLDPFGKETFHD